MKRRYWTGRIARFLLLLAGVSVLSFLLTALTGTDPAEYIARRSSLSATPELIEQIRTTLGLDKPLHIRYLNWIGGVLHGDFGRSIFTGHSVGQDLQSYFPPTLKLVALSMALIVVFTIPVSLVSAARRGRLSDHIVRGVSIVGICLPPFWLGFLLLLAFAVELPIFSVTPEPGLKGLILPAITLAFPVICSSVRVLRASLLEELHRDYIVYSRANGMGRWRLTAQALRNALPPTVTLFCQYVSYLIAGSAVVEQVFSIKGVGSYLMSSIMAADANAIGACMLIVAALYLAAELFGDIINGWLCPWRGGGRSAEMSY